MQTLNLLSDQIGTIEDAKSVINEFHWFLTVDQVAGKWIVKTGETTVFTADSRDAVDAFLYGMALAYTGLPAHLYAKLFNMMAGIALEQDSETTVKIDLADDDERLRDVIVDLETFRSEEGD